MLLPRTPLSDEEVLEPNLDFDLERFEREHGRRVTFNKEARSRFLDFATGPEGAWRGNFRDLNSSVTRLATLSNGGRIGIDVLEDELERPRRAWEQRSGSDQSARLCERVLDDATLQSLDRFDRVQLEDGLAVCARTPNLSAAGRELFSKSRAEKSSKSDYSRLAQYLARFELAPEDLAPLRRTIDGDNAGRSART